MSIADFTIRNKTSTLVVTLLLVVGGDRMRARIEAILKAMQGVPFVFNLGHGIVPQTPPEHVAEMVEVVRDWSG